MIAAKPGMPFGREAGGAARRRPWSRFRRSRCGRARTRAHGAGSGPGSSVRFTAEVPGQETAVTGGTRRSPGALSISSVGMQALPRHASISPASKAASAVVCVLDDPPRDLLDVDAIRTAPLLPLRQRDRLVVLPVRQPVGPVRDDVPGLGPAPAERLRGRAVNRQERHVCDLGDEPRLRARQLHLERALVERLDTDLVAEPGAVLLAAVVLGGTHDPVELVGVARGKLRVEDALPGVLEVGCGDGDRRSSNGRRSRKRNVDRSCVRPARPALRRCGFWSRGHRSAGPAGPSG